MLCLCTAMAISVAAQSASGPSVGEIVSRMQAAENAVQNRPEYTVLREYRLSGADTSSPTSKVLAEIDYIPPGSKQFTIRNTEGNERGETIVRRVLEHEVTMAKDSSNSDFSTANYDFALLGQESLDGRTCYVLQLSPKRDTTELLRGKAWVDASTFLVLRIKGQPAKNPSWWIKDLTVAVDYGRADGIWLPLATRAKAELHLFGTHVLMSKDVQVQTATQNASLSPTANTTTSRSLSRPSSPIADAAEWLARH